MFISLARIKISLVVLLLIHSSVYSQHLKIYVIDVDQAAATLFITPNGSTLLVDAGKNGHGSRIKKILQQEGLNRIDYFVNTHYHEDHFGGIDDLALDPSITIGTAYDRGDKAFLPASKLGEPTYKDYQAAIGHRAIALTRGTQIPIDTAITVTCISHGGVVLGETNPVTGIDENDMSISLLIKYANFRYFVGGDIEAHTENKIAARDLVLDVDVYQSDHHGSHTSSSQTLMQDMIPSVVVISNGSNDKYSHPRQVTLDWYDQLSPAPVVFQTNKYLGSKPEAGNVDDDFIADLDAAGDDGTIFLDVDLDQNQFSVNYRDQVKEFPIKGSQIINPLPGGIVIKSLLPDPIGPETANEAVSITNKTSATVSLLGCVLRDASSKVWTLNSLLQILPNQSLTITRRGMPMSLNNNGDFITLLNQNNVIIDQFQYVGSVGGQVIVTGH